MKVKEQRGEPQQRFLTTEELGSLLRRKPATLRAWRNMRIGPEWLKLEGVGCVLYPSEGVEAWLQRSRCASGLQQRVEVACESI